VTLLEVPALAFARGYGGYIRNIQNSQRQSLLAAQKYQQAVQKQQEAEQKEFLDRFDANHDGKITGKERGPANKYLREKELGMDPDAKVLKQQNATMKVGKKKSSSAASSGN
ncbi:MAG TPA: hypothetical protein VGX76_02725, partial [Pirellulales bacterium]|nr:hypothetical protein [Pirellulales bacterium]